jgi:hypothetical protein
VRDRQQRTTERISIKADGSESFAGASPGGISADGRFVTFTSGGAFVLDDTNAAFDVYLRDRQTQTTTRVSLTNWEGQADGQSYGSGISDDAHVITFTSSATNLATHKMAGTEYDVFARVSGPVAGPALLIETPNTLSRWGIGTTQRLAWTYEGNALQFRVELSRSGGSDWESIGLVTNKPGSAQNFYWSVTGPRTTNGLLRVSAIGDEDATDVNDASIRISPAFIRMLRPAPGTAVRSGDRQRIFWEHNLGALRAVAIDVSIDGGRSWQLVAERAETTGSDTSSFNWTVNVTPTEQARVRVRAIDGSGAFGVSEIFTVLAPSAVQSTALFNFASFACDGGTGVTAGFGTVDFSQVGTVIEATVHFRNGPPNSTFSVDYFATGNGPCQAFSIGSITTDALGNGTSTIGFDIGIHTTFFVVIDGGSTQWATTALAGLRR